MDSSELESDEDDDDYDYECSDDSIQLFDVHAPSHISSERRKITKRIFKDQDEHEESSDVVEVDVPKPDKQDLKSYETIVSIIEAGQVERLKMDECKVYLRKHGLRLSGSKDTLILRIKEHIDITNRGGERRYPASSFLLNCKGDACVGDVVMFKQNVYEVSGGPRGTRVVAGRIVKESYGAAKQQHTFTIEVLWTKGKKPLPPLHPLLIKGRNLYRMKTMRQKWKDETERLKILSEKHARGDSARSHREARIKEREMRNTRWRLGEARNGLSNKKQERQKDPLHAAFMKREKPVKQPEHQHRDPRKTLGDQSYTQKTHLYPITFEASIPIQQRIPHDAQIPAEGFHFRQPLLSMDRSFKSDQSRTLDSSRSQQRDHFEEQHLNYQNARGPIHISSFNRFKDPYETNISKENWSYSGRNMMCASSHPSYSQQNRTYIGQSVNVAQNPQHQEQQVCRYHIQGRCFYGDRCKYLHE